MSYRGHVRNGVVVLDELSPLPEGIEVRVELLPSAADDVLALALQVYAGLSPDEIDEIERIALGRHDFFGGR